MSVATIPRAFIWRRLHSLMGLWLVLFLIEHLLTNSQAALWIGEDGSGFIRAVNALHNFPYLQVIECVLLGVPILIHLVWGVKYALTAKGNAKTSSGKSPALAAYGRNRAFSWQRITSWILLFGLIGHVTTFRFLEYPASVSQGNDKSYFVKIQMDDALYALAYRLNVTLYDAEAIKQAKVDFERRSDEEALLEAADSLKTDKKDFIHGVTADPFQNQKEMIVQSAEKYELKGRWIQALSSFKLDPKEVVAESNSFGTATLLTVRNVFKSPTYIVLYTIFVLAACFHAFNGLWTFLLTWGLLIRRASQKAFLTISISLMVLLAFLGLSSVWGSFWLSFGH